MLYAVKENREYQINEHEKAQFEKEGYKIFEVSEDGKTKEVTTKASSKADAKLEAKVTELETIIATKDTEIESLKGYVTDKDKEVEELEAKVAELEKPSKAKK